MQVYQALYCFLIALASKNISKCPLYWQRDCKIVCYFLSVYNASRGNYVFGLTEIVDVCHKMVWFLVSGHVGEGGGNAVDILHADILTNP